MICFIMLQRKYDGRSGWILSFVLGGLNFNKILNLFVGGLWIFSILCQDVCIISIEYGY